MRTELRHSDTGRTIKYFYVENDVACGLRPGDEISVPENGCYTVVKKHFTLLSEPQLCTELCLFVKERV